MPSWVWERYEGSAIKSIEFLDERGGMEEVRFNMDDGTVVTVYHEQECCESVSIDSMDKEDLLACIGDGPVTFTRRVSRGEHPDETVPVEGAYTFITLQSQHNNATFSFRGESNGRYTKDASMKVGVPTKDKDG